MTKKLIALLFLVSLGTFVLGATTGKITGVITDSETGEPLIGANVIIADLGLGTASDMNGYYALLNIPPGEYNVTANYIGYASMTYNNVRVMIDLTTPQSFVLSTLALEGEAVFIEATRPVVQKDVASSQRHMSTKDIEDMPINSVESVVGLQSGMEGLSVRSGGEDELTLMMDGVTLKDDRTGKPITGIPLSSVQEIMIQSGGFNAEYSDLQAGLINVVTREGESDRYTFSMSYRHSPAAPKHFGNSLFDKDSYFMRPYLDEAVCWEGTDNGAWDENTKQNYPSFQGWNAVSRQLLQDDDPTNDLTPAGAKRLFEYQARREGNITKPDYSIDAGLGGPVPFIGKSLGDMRFFASINANQEMYLAPLSTDGYTDRVATLRLTSDISPKIKLSVNMLNKNISAATSSGEGQPDYFQGIWDVASIYGANSQQSWKLLYPDYYCITDISSNLISAKLTNLLDEKSYYEAILEYGQTAYNTNPGERRDTTLYDIFPGPEEFFTDEGPFGFDDGFTESIAGIFTMGLKSNARDTSTTSRVKAKIDYTNQVNRYNQIKTGVQFEYTNYDLNYGAINPALPVGRPFSKWNRSPFQVDGYIQDKLEFEGWIATVGLRAEYFVPNSDWYDVDEFSKLLYSSNWSEALEDDIPTYRAKPRLTLLPRLGISHPISVNSKLYFNYGHMRQKFNPDELFGVRRVTGGQVSLIGDPEVPPEKTISFELGYDHSLFDQYLLHLSAYYKDKSDQSSTIRYVSADNTVNYLVYSNNLYQDIRGFEVELRKNQGRWFTGFANYSVSIASSGRFGLLTNWQNPSLQREEIEDISRQVQSKPLPRPRLNYSLAFHTPRSFGPSLAGSKVLGDWNMAFTGYWKAGAWATYGRVPGVVNNVRWKPTYTVNGRLSKTYHMGDFNLTFLAEGFNLFNFKHFSTTGWGIPAASDDYQNSLHFKESVYEELGFSHIAGDDRLGDYRPEDVEFQPMEYQFGIYDNNGLPYSGEEGVFYWVEEEGMYMTYSAADHAWSEADNQAVEKALDEKAYIDNPPNASLMFLAPRDIYMGIKFSYNF